MIIDFFEVNPDSDEDVLVGYVTLIGGGGITASDPDLLSIVKASGSSVKEIFSDWSNGYLRSEVRKESEELSLLTMVDLNVL